MNKCNFFLLFLFLFSNSSLANKFYVVVGLAKPPYVIQETNQGFELELISTVLQSMGKQAKFVYVPFGRSLRMLNSDQVDAIMTINSTLINDPDLLSDTYIVYQNVAITLKKNNIKLQRIEDFADISVAAFQTANKILGPSYGEVVNKSVHYVEVANQKVQTELLFKNKASVLVMDINIFRALSPQVGGQDNYQDVDIHYIFDKSPYKMAFKNKAHISEFNHALVQFKSSNDYQKLLEKYRLIQ